jgi:hypothetical protein
MLQALFKVLQQKMLHEQCCTCRSTAYSLCNNNWLVVTLFVVSVSSTPFHQHAEWRLQCKTTQVKKNSTSDFETWISYFFLHYATARKGPRSPHYRGFTITDTPYSAGFLWTSDQPNAETSDNTQHSHPCPTWIRTRNPSKQAATDPHLRPRGHWDRPEIRVT